MPKGMTLEQQLRQYKVYLSGSDFRDILEAAFRHTYPDWSIDDLRCIPAEARKYCDNIRCRYNFRNIPDGVILFALLARITNPEKGHINRLLR